MIGFAVLLTLGTIPWMYAVHVLVLGELNTWAGHLAHAVRNSLATFPLVVLALALSRWLVRRWDVRAVSAADRLALAAFITLVFTLCLTPATVAHPFLDPWLDVDAPAHMLAGHRHSGPTFTNLLARTLRGIRDALIGVPAAFSLALVGLAVPGWQWSQPDSPRRFPAGWAGPVLFAVPVAGAVVILGVGITAVTLGIMETDPEHAAVGRRTTVRPTPTGAAVQVGDIRFSTRSVAWAWHTHEPPPASPLLGAPHPTARRLLVQFSVANLGSQVRVFSRSDVRLQAVSGRAWSPLAHGLPPIVLQPREVVHSMLVFDAPASEARLELAWVSNGRQARLPIGSARDSSQPHRGG